MATVRSLEGRSQSSRAWNTFRRVIIGQPLTTADLLHERLTKVKALAVLASDAVSSSAYAPEEILTALILAGSVALSWTLPVAMAIAVLLAIVAISYAQTIKAYPRGGGSYIVTKDNLGTVPSLIAAGSLLTDYTLTVAVSISAGVAALTSAIPELHPHRVLIALGFVLIITVVNLRGVKESGTIFAAPTYLFILGVLVVVGAGAYRLIAGLGPVENVTGPIVEGTETLSIFLVLRAFASGCAALTGTEAISDGVPAFQPPEWRNARHTLFAMAIVLGTLFLGICFLASAFGVIPRSDETVPSQVARAAVGIGPIYYFFQAVTMLILVLAANTSFSDFPRLSYFLARDHFMPHQFQYRGDRLAFSTGITVLGVLASILVFSFNADTHALIPLYAIGVFVSFTFSQSSMVRRWWKRREPGWHWSLPINAVGAVTTGVVSIVIAATKFEHGAWMILIIIPTIVLLLLAVNRHYQTVADELTLEHADALLPSMAPPFVIVPIEGLHRGTLHALAFAKSISSEVAAVMVTDDMDEAGELKHRWERWGGDVPLVILESPYRSLVGPLLAYIDAAQAQHGGATVTVVLQEYVPKHWWGFLLHNQTALRVKMALFFRTNTVVVDAPYHLNN